MLAEAGDIEREFDAFQGIDLGVVPAARPGALLRRARETLGVSLIEIAQSTRIPLRHLDALEQGRYDTVRARIYAVGFARSYARFVGLAEQPIASAVRDEYDAARAAEPMHHWA